MVKAVAVVVTLLALVAHVAAQNTNCAAKYRYQWFYQLTDPTPANLKAVDSLVMKFMRDDCDKVLFFGQGPAISIKPAAYGFAAASPTAEFADYGAWSDWASTEDIKSCYINGVKSGNVEAIRKYMKKASRVIYELHSCSTVSNTPATVRFMYNYMLKDFSPATCKKAADLQAILRVGKIRSEYGCDALNGDTKIFGQNVPVTGQYGGSDDHASQDSKTKWLTTTDARTAPALKEIRTLAASSIRTAIALPANSYTGGGAKVAKERAAMP